jgi:hypothetical protein
MKIMLFILAAKKPTKAKQRAKVLANVQTGTKFVPQSLRKTWPVKTMSLWGCVRACARVAKMEAFLARNIPDLAAR